MDINKRILKVGLWLIALSFITSIGIANYLKLDNPVFYENYRRVYLYENGQGRFQESDFRISYLTNNDDNRRVVGLHFKEAPQLGFRADGFILGPGDTYGRYSEREVYIKTEEMFADLSLDGLELNNAVITFNNGDVIETEIGRIILSVYKDKGDFIERTSTGSSSDGTSSSEIQINKNIFLEKLDSPLLENIQNNIQLVVDGRAYKEISGLPYKSGDTLRINSTYKFPEDIMSRFTMIEFDFDLYFKDVDNNLHSTRVHFINYQPYQNDTNLWDVISYLRQRGEI